MSELKILIHIGHHLNVVNLLGACTKAGGKKCSLNTKQRRSPSQLWWYFNVSVVQCPSLVHALLMEAQGVLVLLQIWPHHINGFWNFSPATGVTSLSFLSFSFVSSFTKENMNCREMGSFIAVQFLSLPHEHHISFQRCLSPSSPSSSLSSQDNVPG